MEIGLPAEDSGRVEQARGRKQGSRETLLLGIQDPVEVPIIAKEVVQRDAFDQAQFVHGFKRTPLGLVAQARITQRHRTIGAAPVYDRSRQFGGHPRQHRQCIGIGPVEVELARLVLKVESHLIQTGFGGGRIAAQDPHPGFTNR